VRPFGLYTDIQPALDRPDIFLAVTKYAEEPEPYRDLLHFPTIEKVLVPLLFRRLAKLEVQSDAIPRLSNLGLQEERYFLAYTLGRLSVAPSLRLLCRPVPPSFWPQLHQGLEALHSQGLSYGHLREDSVAITDQGTPLLFDLTGLRSVEKQPSDVDIAARGALEARFR
jgi:hypothetical protein